MRTLFLAALIAGGSCIALADGQMAKPEEVGLSSERLTRIAALMQAHIAAHDVSGAVTLVARHGKVVHLQAQGLADLDARRQMRSDTLFRMFSMTKPLTAVSILMLMEEGKLLLSDPVSKYIPEFRDQKVAVVRPPNDPLPTGAGVALVPVARPVTLKDLLTHTAGMGDSPEAGPAAEYIRRANLPTTGTLAERVQREGALPLNFQPGSHWQYSGTFGFDALARVVEIQSGVTLDQFFRGRIFEPLGMHDSFFQVPADHAGNMALPYTKSDKGLTGASTPPSSVSYFSGAGGSGGIAATASDYARFCQMLLNGGQLDGKRLLSRKAVELMTSDAIPGLDLRNYLNGLQVLQGYGFGLGVRVRRNNGENGWLGSPGDYGWAGARGTYFWIDPKEDLIGIMLIETPIVPLRMEFPNAVYQAVVD
jgi:CubicO group peptidase (beta-lactamase class C family)